jgi:hypothetical protein
MKFACEFRQKMSRQKDDVIFEKVRRDWPQLTGMNGLPARGLR